MSILETFYILFKSDASDVKKGADEAKKSTDSVANSLAHVNKTSENVGASFLKMARSFAGLVAAGTASALFIANLKAATNYGIELDKTSRLLGVNIEDLDAWGQAVQRTGGSAAQFQNSLHSLAQHFGASPRIALKLLPQLADAFEKMGRLRAMHYGKMLGLDEATILLLQQGRREVQAVIDQQKQLGVITQKDAETFRQFNNTLADTEHATRSLFSRLALDSIPVIEKLLKATTKFVEFLMRHKDLVIGALIAIGAASLTIIIPFVIANAAIIGTVAAIGLLVGAFAFLYDDVKTFFEGGDSLIGRWIDRWSDLKNIISDIVNILSKFSLIPGVGAIKLAKEYLFDASTSPLGSQSSNSLLAAQGGNRNQTVNVTGVTINTQATDAAGIGTAFGTELQKMLRQSNDNFADGIAY